MGILFALGLLPHKLNWIRAVFQMHPKYKNGPVPMDHIYCTYNYLVRSDHLNQKQRNWKMAHAIKKNNGTTRNVTDDLTNPKWTIVWCFELEHTAKYPCKTYLWYSTIFLQLLKISKWINYIWTTTVCILCKVHISGHNAKECLPNNTVSWQNLL